MNLLEMVRNYISICLLLFFCMQLIFSRCYIAAVGDYLNRSGFTPIAERLAEPIKNKIMTNAKVTKISTLGPRSRIHFVDSLTGSKRLIKARKVVVTVPLGVLKKGNKGIRFKPPLPEWKKNVSRFATCTYLLKNF